MVFQSYALYPHMTVYNNIAFGLRRRDIAREQIDERVRSAAAKLGLTDLLDRKPHALSGGQRQRVALGRAIVRDPKAFLFDEPLSNLDAALRVTTRNELIRQQREIGTTSIFVTHDQVEAMTMGDRICVMNKGRVAQIGRPLDVYRNPADTFVARFIGNPAMNLFNARLETVGGRRVVSLGGSALRLPDHLEHRLAARPDGEVILGIRPEDMFAATPSRPAAATMSARVITVEALGAETLLLVALGQANVEAMIRTGRDAAFTQGDSVEAGFDTDAIHLFDSATTRAIN